MKKILKVFLCFLKIGAFAFGGGYGMLALLERELVAKKKWLEKDEYVDMLAIAESTPGPVAINSATYIGYKLGGVPGAAAATLAVCIPSFVIIFVISLFFDSLLQLRYVAYAFRGIQACVIYLIFSAGMKLMRETEKKPLSIVIIAAVMSTMLAFSLFSVSFSSVFYILICGTIGLTGYFIALLRKKSGVRK